MKGLLCIGIGALLGSGITYKYWKQRYDEVVDSSKELALTAWEMSREIYNAEIEHIKKYSTKKNYYD